MVNHPIYGFGQVLKPVAIGDAFVYVKFEKDTRLPSALGRKTSNVLAVSSRYII